MLGGALIISDKKTRPKFETNIASKAIVPFGYHDDDFFAGISVISNITYFDDGETSIGNSSEYHSHNTQQLDEKELRSMLINLHEIQNDLVEFKVF